MLVRLIYCSRAQQPIEQALVDDILLAARKYNPPLGITGLLCYSKDVFVQVLEGSRVHVSRLYLKLARDARHHSLTLLSFSEIEQRKFANWSMAEVALDQLNASILLRHSSLPVLDPFIMPGASVERLLEDLAESGTIQYR
ncbi:MULTISPECIES: BLUF domain-containing protein [Chromobacterium]|uniref:BLUF domain-containing protein n=2 Tax=Chromobacterium TaxID=535 RepID=A0A1S1WYA9_9NEIS|nr:MULTISPECIES: BLUF domain-containing protein [Chromobacterium]KIA80698.1 blue light sensor protein [Chromobacterium piscinae]MBM2886628.1 BLUF domain-containing protein [Chromobacterium amazonense]MDE1711923.1 BLUF domain-containing protein [Chromobacterium amazonense]MDQ4541418.1 BLUF domain-containing protein [Chromobacterium amazonense]OHX12048.1 blue light sensor protein [Chromobacterium amazonense]